MNEVVSPFLSSMEVRYMEARAPLSPGSCAGPPQIQAEPGHDRLGPIPVGILIESQSSFSYKKFLHESAALVVHCQSQTPGGEAPAGSALSTFAQLEARPGEQTAPLHPGTGGAVPAAHQPTFGCLRLDPLWGQRLQTYRLKHREAGVLAAGGSGDAWSAFGPCTQTAVVGTRVGAR